MRLTSFTDYSLRVLIYLAAAPGQRATIGEIADTFAISRSHLMKVVQFLGQAGWLRNIRGRGGGLELAADPAAINVGAVVHAAEGAALPAECFVSTGSTCVITRACHLRGVFAEAVDAFQAVLDRYTLADITFNQAALVRILHPRGRARRTV